MQGKKISENKQTKQQNQYISWIFYGLKSVYSEGKVEYIYSFNVNVETQHISSWSEITEKTENGTSDSYFLTRQKIMI